MKFCPACDKQVMLTAVIYPNCGAAQTTQTLVLTQPPAMTFTDLLFSFQGRTSLWTY